MPSIAKTAAGWMQGVSILDKVPAGRQNQTNLLLHSDRKQDPLSPLQKHANCSFLGPYAPC